METALLRGIFGSLLFTDFTQSCKTWCTWIFFCLQNIISDRLP